MTLEGQGGTHLQAVLARLIDRFHATVDTAAPQTPNCGTVTKSIEQHARYKKLSGGHGQFGDVKVTVRPRPRGEGFNFSKRVVGGAVPRNFIPRSAMAEGLPKCGPILLEPIDHVVSPHLIPPPLGCSE